MLSYYTDFYRFSELSCSLNCFLYAVIRANLLAYCSHELEEGERLHGQDHKEGRRWNGDCGQADPCLGFGTPRVLPSRPPFRRSVVCCPVSQCAWSAEMADY